nr:restriction endonuclease subunit S [Pseudomonadota bacterium]
NYRIVKDDIVMGMTGYAGKAGKYEFKEPALLNQRVCRLRDNKKANHEFVWYILNSTFYAEHIFLTAYGTAQSNISDKQLVACKVPCPPLAEQKAIADFLDCKTAEIDATKDRITTAIDTLMEYRTALITNAVTGKIDVRHTAK